MTSTDCQTTFDIDLLNELIMDSEYVYLDENAETEIIQDGS